MGFEAVQVERLASQFALAEAVAKQAYFAEASVQAFVQPRLAEAYARVACLPVDYFSLSRSSAVRLRRPHQVRPSANDRT